MFRVESCPVCAGKSLRVLKTHAFSFPGEQVQEHLLDYRYFALWTLFERVLQDRSDALFELTLCECCGFIYSNPRFTEEDMATKYTTFNELGTPELGAKHHPPFNLEGRAKRGYDLVNKYYPFKGEGRPKVLDFGGGAGYNLAPFTRDWECGLVDYGRWEFPEGVTKLGNDHRDLSPDQTFQVILLLHTLEHVPEPVALLKTLAEHLEDDGAMYIEVPLGAFGEWKFMNEPLMHLNFFSEESVCTAASEAGLHLAHVETRYQWVTHAKLWCINLIAYKNPDVGPVLDKRPLTTRAQMGKLNYYLPYAANPRVVKKVLRKVTGC